MRTLTLTLILTLAAAEAHGVTYQRTATLNDGSFYLYEVTFDISALDDNVVDDTEGTSSLSITGGAFDDSFYNDDELTVDIEFINGTGLGIDPTDWEIVGVMPGKELFDIAEFDGGDPIEQGELLPGDLEARGDRGTSQWIFVPDSPTVPEPLTASLLSLAVAPLLLRRRREA